MGARTSSCTTGSVFMSSTISSYVTRFPLPPVNGARVPRIDNQIIGDQDKLLVSYDVVGTDVMAQYNSIENEAAHYDQAQDPASCGGLNGPGHDSAATRLKRAIGISE